MKNDRKEVYPTDSERKIVTEFLLAIGWKQSESGIWFKDGLKNENGQWKFILKRYRKRYRDKNKEKIKEHCKISNHLYYMKRKRNKGNEDRFQ
jgi:hypothetical protein